MKAKKFVMKRRNFIMAMSSTLASLHFSGNASGNQRPDLNSSTQDQLKAMFNDPDNARDIGRFYLNAYPDHATRAYLEQQIGLGNSLDPVKSFEDKRQQDFLVGNTVTMDGWVLAKAEVCVCALLAMSTV